jgi:hypothetical protein|tara:strand:+ start:3179 stop:3508 length:330 start_codon:yes stop_codon:yes gene_type:complete
MMNARTESIQEERYFARDMSRVGVISFALGVIGFISFLISISIIGYIDDRIEEECDTEAGTIGQIIGADEGQCQDARDWRNVISSLQIPMLGVGALLGFSGGMLIVRDY